MLIRNELHFERRSILTAAQLRTIEKFPREILRLKYADFGNGIISGMDFVERDDKIFLTEGLFKIGNFFYLAEEINLSSLAQNTRDGIKYIFALTEPQRTASENVVTEKISVEVKPLEENFNSLELGRFRAGLGINLPEIDVGAEDLFDEFTNSSCLQILNVHYSVRGGTTFHPYIFRAVLNKLELKENPTPSDTALMIHLANFGVATIPSLKIYVKGNGVEWNDDSRENIFRSILDALKAKRKINFSEINSAPSENVETVKNRGRFFL